MDSSAVDMFVSGKSVKLISQIHGISYRKCLNHIKKSLGQTDFKNIRYINHSSKMKGKTTITTAEYKNRISDRSFELLGEYLGSSVHTPHLCNVCGNVWDTTPNNILSHLSLKCPECAMKSGSALRAKSPKQFLAEVAQHNKYLDILGEYVSESIKVKVVCKTCREVWCKNPRDVIAGSGCKKCQQGAYGTPTKYSGVMYDSKFEAAAAEVIYSYFTDVERQKPYPDTNYKCDFYITNLNLWIEVSSIKTVVYLNRIREKKSLVKNFLFVNNITKLKEIMKMESENG